MFELTEIMRQKDNKVYAELLSRLREGIHSQDDIEKLKSRIIDESYPHYPYDAVHMSVTVLFTKMYFVRHCHCC